MTHTPTPWRIGSVSNEYQSIVCDDNANGVTIWLANADARGNVASHIVKCVNMHDELVEGAYNAQQRILGVLRNHEAGESLNPAILRGALDALNAALAKASEEA